VALAWEFVQQDRFWPWRGGGETSAAGALAPRVAYCLQVRAQKEKEVRRWLTKTWNGLGRDADVPAARSGGGVQAELEEEAMWWSSKPADPPNRSVQVLRRCRGGEKGPGIAGIQESHGGQRAHRSWS